MLQDEVDTLKNELNNIQAKEKKNNIIVFNAEDTKQFNNQIKEKTLELLTTCEVNIKDSDIVNISRLGKSQNKRPLRIELTDSKFKKELFSKSDNFRKRGIYLSNDLTIMQQKDRKKLVEAKKELQSLNISAKIRNERVIVDEKEYSLAQSLSLLASLKNGESTSSTIRNSHESSSPEENARTRKRVRKEANPGSVSAPIRAFLQPSKLNKSALAQKTAKTK
ncbi:unnamed protein product [Trichogramma brassicae]|uniref:Endonuclease-reverse transcriptase n=1 Tax=Trichogramma brassicae TaxID=86971 RepID=A0A6H5ICU5_9HYME|nr:unnamed protein product [Trichogramma brassicae]